MRKILAYTLLSIALLIIYGDVAMSFFIDLSKFSISTSVLLFNLLFNFFLMVGTSFAFVYLYYGKNLLKELYFRKERAIEAVAIGAGACGIFILIQIAVSIVMYSYGYREENPLLKEIAKEMNLFLLFLIPLSSSISEETFYRGLIQMHLGRKIGMFYSVILTSLLFAIAHLQYHTLLQFLFPFLLSLMLGFLIYKWENILAPISAHFMYNFINLLFVSYGM
ncbi:MAG: CPBP family intramembrane metalloprotease [Thermoplasmata archaeon]|nr:MAG: CPBP family intramembrane metalloprotease [Thermoplasmata archaeon]